MGRIDRFVAVVACLAWGCSSSSTSPSPDGGGSDAAVDAPIGPIVCSVPMASTCPASAPCTFSGWACAAPACQGYFVVTDGTWTYYYASPGLELVGIVSVADAGVEACPYGFEPPAGCPATAVSPCASDAGPG
jgi:hypothetical protein